MVECDLRFSSSSAKDTGSFKLLELPPDLLKLIEASIDTDARPTSLTIKGAKDDDAVLCTADKTYAVRSVVLSNSVLVVTPDPTATLDADEPAEEVFIRDQLNEVIELVPSVPRLHKLNSLLRGREFDEGHEDEDMDSLDENEAHSQLEAKRRKFTYEDALSTIQASDAELNKGLKDRRVLILKGELRPIAPSYLTTILELILTNLVSHSLTYTSVPVVTLMSALEDEHDILRDVSRQVMAWFGQLTEQGRNWEMEANAVIREIGLGILRAYRDEPTPEDDFMVQWRKAVGDTFEDKVSLPLLSGNFLTSLDTLSTPPKTLLTYFPSSELPVEAGARFAELFLARLRWKVDEIAPFLADIAIDVKERDKLLLKHARAVTDPAGVFYTARAKYNA